MTKFFSVHKVLLFLLLCAALAVLCALSPIAFAEGDPLVREKEPLPEQEQAAAAPMIRLASIYSDRMVLQREKEIRIRGTLAQDGVLLTASLGEATSETTVSDGEWELVFPPMPAAHDLKLTITPSDPSIAVKTISDIEIGEVWLACGQSNMELNLSTLPDADEYLNNAADYQNLRLFYRGNVAALEESEPTPGKWSKTTDLAAVKKSSAIGYVFATELADAMPDVTIAIVDANYYGTAIISWLDAETLRTEFDREYQIYQKALADHLEGKVVEEFRRYPSGCFNATIAPLAGITCRGVLWYQGESDSGNPADYEITFSSLVSLYRRFFRNDALPFYTFQLAPYPSRNFMCFRMAQYDMAYSMENVHLISTGFNGPTYSIFDNRRVSIGQNDFHVHPTCKAEPAIHCAREALAEEYGIGKEKVYKAPVLLSVSSVGKTVTLTFDTDLKLFYGTKPEGFYIMGGATKYEASGEIRGKTIVLTSQASSPTGVLYGAEEIVIECKDGKKITGVSNDVTDDSRWFTTITHADGKIVFRAGENDALRSTCGGNVTNQSGAPLPSFYVDMRAVPQLLS